MHSQVVCRELPKKLCTHQACSKVSWFKEARRGVEEVKWWNSGPWKVDLRDWVEESQEERRGSEDINSIDRGNLSRA